MGRDESRTAAFMGLSEVAEDPLSLWRQLIAEFIGTGLLVIMALSSATLFPGSGSITQIAFTVGLTVASIVQAIGHVSGGHINPAVTVGLLFSGGIGLLRAVCYILAQMAGALAGAGILWGAVPATYIGTFGLTKPGRDVLPEQALLMEVIITFILVLVVKGVTDPKRNDIKGSAPLAIGLAVGACHAAAIGFSGAGMNPARSFGPAVIANDFENHWVYWAGPFIGAILAGVIYQLIFRARKN